MELIVIDNRLGRSRRWQFDPRSPWIIVVAVATVGLFIAAGIGIGRLTAPVATAQVELPDDVTAEWQAAIDENRQEVADTRQYLQENTQALARKVALLQADMMRLNAAGQRLIEVADLDEGEFAFDAVPAVGGPELDVEGELPALEDVNDTLGELDRQIADREREMRVLEDLILASRLQSEAHPEGRPILSGWISSLFGTRTDPFTGRRAQHYGMDFAGREGSEVVAVASGVVTWAGRRHGYGMLVEINHGNGYVTRYGHNQKHEVKVGDRVAKGEVIALMGNTGRSTGPHVHFEVLRNGRVVNPAKYIKSQG
ncbi:peptidoglycan DD-metalloendopeptidase family protein [uncultured Abyssibacter sp.]|uniref:M23 family metallopeptidase n=1 Tax=uncultured Abyssibacter sp. TaxID=2320202 RepID=UPI0032B27114